MSQFDHSMPISEERLSRISTHWSKLADAKNGSGPDVRAAQAVILTRYWKAVVRYLYSILKDADAVEECSQEFALRFVRGDFRNLNLERGRFRDFLRTSLMNLARDHLRQKAKQPRQYLADGSGYLPISNTSEPAPDFDQAWRQEIVNKVWENLSAADQGSPTPYYQILRMKSESPNLRSSELAREVSLRMGREITASSCRQLVHRAREKFASLLFDEVRRSLDAKDDSEVHNELAELGLAKYCQWNDG